MSEVKVAVSGFNRSNERNLPVFSLKDVWDRKLFPLKKRVLIDKFGQSLRGLDFKLVAQTASEKDFDVITEQAGFGPPLRSSLRFLLSDEPISRLPKLETNHKLLIAIEIAEELKCEAHPRNEKVLRIGLPGFQIKNCIYDVLLDFSFANFYLQERFMQFARLDGPQIFGKKVEFLIKKKAKEAQCIGLDGNAPYASFSAVAREDRKFGSIEHLERFVSLWDEFYAHIIPAKDRVDLATNLLLKFPKIGGQLSRQAVRKCLQQAPSAPHLFIVRKRSKEFASQDVQDRLHAAFSLLKIRGTGARDFGVLQVGGEKVTKDEQVAKNLFERLADEGMVYVVRVIL